MRFSERLNKRIQQTNSALCVGLDPRPQLTDGGVEGILPFLKQVVAETAEYTAAYKPNMAYFEAMGLRGIEILEELLGDMPDDIPVILDAKRSDIGETQKYYAISYFKTWKVDAVTLNPFLGYDTIEPFLDWEGKGIYLLAVTSNPGSADLQRRDCEGKPVYQHIGDFCTRALTENRNTDTGLVVGLTNASGDVLANLPDVPLLIPGLGAQGGDLDSLKNSGRKAPPAVNVSRGILYAEPDLSFGEKARRWADKISQAIS